MSLHVLLVEDNEGDVVLISDVLDNKPSIRKVSVVKDGREALDFLDRKGLYGKEELPGLVILDINLPKVNGHEVLRYIKQKNELKHLPVIVFTTSSSFEDIALAYRNYANCYITKPLNLDDFQQVISGIEEYWMHVVQLPRVR